MSRRLLMAAASLTLLVPAAASAAPGATPSATHVRADAGAIAGRSPHHAYRPIAAAPACGRTMHTIPAGKLPVHGTHAFPAAGCGDATELAAGAAANRISR